MKAELIDSMGSDLTVVNAARVSFDKESAWEYTLPDDGTGFRESVKPYMKEQDKKLIKYLAKHGHWTPFSHPQIMMRETVPIFVARQRFKHMVGFTYNEISRRYVDDYPELYFPDEWRGKAGNKKQGSAGPLREGEQARADSYYKAAAEKALRVYDKLLRDGVCPEQARMVLPQSMYTSYYVTGSLAAWARAYKQRIDAHAQKEIQDLARQWGAIIAPLFPVSWAELTK